MKTRRAKPGALFLVIWYLVPGTWYLVPGTCYSITPPFFVCGTPSTIHFGSGVPFR